MPNLGEESVSKSSNFSPKSPVPEPLNLSDFPGTGDLKISGTGNFKNDKNHHFLSQKISNRILPKLIEFTRDTVTGDLNSALMKTSDSYDVFSASRLGETLKSQMKTSGSYSVFSDSRLGEILKNQMKNKMVHMTPF